MYKLPKKYILRKNKSFQAIYRAGKSIANKKIVLYILPNGGQNFRVGFAAGKRLGNAVVRNRVKRLLREAFRHNQHRLLKGYDIIIVGRQAVVGEKMNIVADALIRIFAQAGILVK